MSPSTYQGKAVGVIGESGCGKSTLARVVSGLLPASAGDVLLDDSGAARRGQTPH